MKSTDFNTTILVDQTPKGAFDAILNMRGWWSEEIEGDTSKLNEEFNYHFEDIHRCRIRLVELITNKRIVWLIVSNYFKFTKDTTEWTGTHLVFEISSVGNKTQVHFTHVGLVERYECYEVCSNAWHEYIDLSLRNLITTGKGRPNATGKPRTADEKRLRETK